MGRRSMYRAPRRRRGALALLGGLATVAGCGHAPPADRGQTRILTDAAAARVPIRPAVIALIRAADWIGSEWTEDALRTGLAEEGLAQGRDYEFRSWSARGDPATLPSLIDGALDARASVIVTLQDATLQAVVTRVRDTPVIFDILSDPFAAGAGTSDSSHLPNVSGVYSPGFGDPEQRRRVELIRRMAPEVRRLGVLFSPGEPVSVDLRDRLSRAAREAGLEVVTAPVNTSGDAAEATHLVLNRGAEVIQIFGNAAHDGFESILASARERQVPVFSPSPFELMKGATAALYPDFQEGGVVAGHMIARVLKGERPATIPFYRLERTQTSVTGSRPLTDAAGTAVPR